MRERAARVAALAGATLGGTVAIEATARQLTRTRPVPGLPEDPLALAGLAGVGLAAALLWGRSSSARVWLSVLAVGLALQLHMGARLQSDGFYYYAYLRSLAFDRDVNFLNDYALLGQQDKPHLFEPTVTGYAHSAWTIGPAILWSPFFAAGHVAASGLRAGGADVAADGTSYPYRQAVVMAGLCYALVGAWFTFRLARQFSAGSFAAAGAAVLMCGSFMAWYALVEPTMTHAPSMAVVAGFVWAWTATRRGAAEADAAGTWQRWACLGALAGFAGLIRWQNVLFALLPAAEACGLLLASWRRGDAAAMRRVVARGLLFTAAAVVAFLPQMLAWRAIYGSWLAVSPLGPTIAPLEAHIVDVLFSSRNGLFAMSPVTYLGAAGLLALGVARPAVGLPFLGACAAMTWFNASIYDWWGSDGFGGRRFDGLIPMLAVGAAIALERGCAVIARRPQMVAAAVLGAAVVWNLTLMSAAQRSVVRLGEPMSFSTVGADQARTLHGWIGHPFSYPVNLWYALRNGVRPADYDLLAPFRFLGDRARPYGQIDVGFVDGIYLREGWHAPEREGDRTFRWATERAQVLVPLDHAAPLDVLIRLRGFAATSAPPQRLALRVNGRLVGDAAVPGEWATLSFQTPAGVWRAGVTRLALEFAWAIRPVDAGMGTDTRPLAAAVDNIRVSRREGGS